MFDRVLRSGHREGVATKYPPQGKPVMALIDSNSYRIEAYFEETESRTSELAPVRRFTSWTDRLRCKERFRA